MTYQRVLDEISGRKYLLLGNGFSVACDGIFSYTNLFGYARENGLTEHVLKVFDYLGTNNFEGVLRLLEDGKWMSKHYELKTQGKRKFSITKDFASVKRALLNALTKTHLPYPASITDERKDKCVEFFAPYQTIFTTNYDLLLYWVSNYALDKLKQQNGFRASIDDPGAKYLVFSEHLGPDKGILFIHGALHLYVEHGEVCKHSWLRSGESIIELVKKGLTEGQYPHFVAEGKAYKKMQQIQRSDYMSYCLGKLGRISSPLVIYGFALNENDYHIVHVIAENKNLERVYIGLFEKPEHPTNKSIHNAVKEMQNRRALASKGYKRFKELKIEYFDSKTVSVWN